MDAAARGARRSLLRGSLVLLGGTARRESDDLLTLRDAANIIGFRSFPIGWAWTEFGLRKSAKIRPYEARARGTSQLGIAGVSSEPEGLIAVENAIRFRCKTVQRSLYRIISGMRVPLIIYNADAHGRIAGEREALDQTLQLNVVDGNVSLHGYKEHAEIDGPKLIEHLDRVSAPWQTKIVKHGWLLAQRLARNVFEVHGCRFSDQEIIRQCRDQYTNIRVNSPDLDQSAYASLVATLRQEYEASDE
jgi:hypothetical protein